MQPAQTNHSSNFPLNTRLRAVLVLGLLALAALAPPAAASWTEETALTGDLITQSPTVRVAGDPDGLLAAAWVREQGLQVWMAVSSAGTWATPVASPPAVYTPGLLSVAASSPAGIAVVVWSESGFSFSSGPLKAAVYTAAFGWLAPVQMDAGGALAQGIHAAVDDNGNVVVVWAQYTTPTYVYTAWARSYTVTGGWSNATQIDSGGYPSSARVAAGPGGTFMAVWNSQGRVYARPFVAGAGWGQATGPLDNGNSQNPTVVGLSDGSWLAAWTQANSSPQPSSLVVNRNQTGVGWLGPVDVASPPIGSSTEFPMLAAGPSGNVTVAWVGTRAGTQDLLARTYSVLGGWGAAFAIDASDAPVQAAAFVSASGGQARAVWTQPDGASVTVWSAYQTADGPWSAPELVECRLAASSTPAVALSPSGNATALFAQNEWGAYKLWWNRFTVGSADPLGTLRVDGPGDGAALAQADIVVSGVSRADATLSVNGIAASIAADGSFEVPLHLAGGANTLLVVQRLPCGESHSLTLSVTFTPAPDPAIQDLQAALNASNANASALAARVAALEANVTQAWAAIFELADGLGDTNAALSSLDARVAALDASVAVLQNDNGRQDGELASARAEIDALNGSVADADLSIQAAEARVAALEARVAGLSGSTNVSTAALWDALEDVRGKLNRTGDDLTSARLNLSKIDGKVETLETTGAKDAGAGSSSVALVLAIAVGAGLVGLLVGRRRAAPSPSRRAHEEPREADTAKDEEPEG